MATYAVLTRDAQGVASLGYVLDDYNEAESLLRDEEGSADGERRELWSLRAGWKQAVRVSEFGIPCDDGTEESDVHSARRLAPYLKAKIGELVVVVDE